MDNASYRPQKIQVTIIIYFISHTYFIALLGCMKKSAANCPLKPGMLSSLQNPHIGINSVIAFFERQARAGTLVPNCMGLH